METTQYSAALEPRLTRFWGWWRDHRSEFADAMSRRDANRLGRIGRALTTAVHEVDQRLTWEVGPGFSGAELSLVVSASGDPAVRGVARRLRMAAPQADHQWVYSDLRMPHSGGGALTLAGVTLDVEATRVVIQTTGALLDVAVWHPAFADLPENTQGHMAVMLLDSALGEERVEVWIGHVDVLAHEPDDGVTLEQARVAVDDLRAMFLTEDGTSAWAVLEGQGSEAPRLTRVQVPLHPLTNPLLEHYVRLILRYADEGKHGLPGPVAYEQIQTLEDQIDEVLGVDGALVAVETGGFQVVWHAYVDPATRVAANLEDLGHRHGAHVTMQDDPTWEIVGKLR